MKKVSVWSVAVGSLVAVNLFAARAEEAAKPAVEAAKPAVEAAKPAVEAAKPAVEAAKPAAPVPVVDKAALLKQREQEQAQKNLENVKKDIAGCAKQIQTINDASASGKDKDSQPYRDKQLGFLNKTLDLLQQTQKALEAQDANQAGALQDQLKALRIDWSTVGEMAARFDMEKARLNSKYGADAPPEIKAAVEQYVQNCDAILAKAKEGRDLQLKQAELQQQHRELGKKIEMLAMEVQKQKMGEAKQKKAPEQKKEVPAPVEKK